MDWILRNTKVLQDQLCSLEGSGAYHSSGGRSGSQGCTAHTVALQTQLCRNNSQQNHSLLAASPQHCSHTLQHTEHSLSWEHGAELMAKCLSPGVLRQASGAALSAHTISLCSWHIISKTTLQPFSSLPEDSGCVPTQAREGQVLTLAQRVVEVAWSTLVT